MAFLYLSPSTQEYNPYVNGGNEEYYMNLLADELEPYLHASGISFTRTTPSMTAATSIAASNAGDYDLHLALHSNATAGDQAGTTTGIDLYYNPESAESLRAAQLIQQQLKTVYPNPTKVAIVPTTSLGEVYKVRAPGVLAELGYHDNPSDADWIRNNLPAIARSLARAVTEFFGLPFLEPQAPRVGVVDLNWGVLNLRAAPSTSAPIVAQCYDGAQLTVWNEYQNWFVVAWNGLGGYVWRDYVVVQWT